MEAVLLSALARWANFYVIVGSSAGALTGLQFVVVALIAQAGRTTTKREIRAVSLSTLAPRGGELLWDIGAGSGAIGIEWLLAHPANRAIGIEAREDRLGTARANAQALGVPHYDLKLGAAPEALKGLPTPDAVFVGGGASRDGVLDAVWQALPPGGRLVVNAVTLETEAILIAWQARHGGALLQLSVERAGPVGGRTGWRAAMPVVQWSVTK